MARVQVLKVPVDAAMTVKLECNHSTKQVGGGGQACGACRPGWRTSMFGSAMLRSLTAARASWSPLPASCVQVKLQLVKGNMLMRRYEGVYTIVPFSSGAQPALPPGLAETLGPATWRQLTAKLSEAALQPNASNSCGGGGGAGGSKAVQQQQRQQARRAQHSLVILHQRLQPALRPPPGLGGYVRGERAAAEGMTPAAAAPCPGTCSCSRAASQHLTPVSCRPLLPLPLLVQARSENSLSACWETCTAPANGLATAQPSPPCCKVSGQAERCEELSCRSWAQMQADAVGVSCSPTSAFPLLSRPGFVAAGLPGEGHHAVMSLMWPRHMCHACVPSGLRINREELLALPFSSIWLFFCLLINERHAAASYIR